MNNQNERTKARKEVRKTIRILRSHGFAKQMILWDLRKKWREYKSCKGA